MHVRQGRTLSGGTELKTTTTAKVIVQVRGPDVTYGLLRFAPDVSSGAGSIDVNSFAIRSGNDRYTLSDFPIIKALPKTAREDILYVTYEADDDERGEFLEVHFEISEYDEKASIAFRAVECDMEMIHFEVEDQAGDWLPVEDVILSELLPDSFLRVMELSAMSMIHDHNLDRLPMLAES